MGEREERERAVWSGVRVGEWAWSEGRRVVFEWNESLERARDKRRDRLTDKQTGPGRLE